MARKTKTISVKWLIDHVNEFNRTSADILKSEREGKNMFLECILRETGNYYGFSYLFETELSGDAMSVGIREQNGDWNFDDTDSTRVQYYYYD